MKNHYEKLKGYEGLHKLKAKKDSETGLLCLDLTDAPPECIDDFTSAVRNWNEVFWSRETAMNTELNYMFLMDVVGLFFTLPVAARIADCGEARRKQEEVQNMYHEHRIFAYILKAIPELNKHKLIKIVLPRP